MIQISIPQFFQQCTPLTFQLYRFAAKLHEDQGYITPKGYMVEHVLPVVLLTAQHSDWDEDAINAALLHDLLEDTDCTVLDLIQQGVPLRVCQSVQALTQPRGGLSRKVRVKAMLEQLSAHGDWRTILVKLADRLVNVRSCWTSKNASLLSMYTAEYKQFRATLHPLCTGDHTFSALWEQLDTLHGFK